MGLLLAALLLAAGSSAADRPAPTRAGLSWAEADALGAKLEALDKRQKNGRTARPETIEISEAEVNSYVNLEAHVPVSVADITVHMDRDRLAATATVDLDKIAGRPTSSSPLNPLSFLGGRVPVSVSGKLVVEEDGFASVQVEEVRLGSFPVPVAVLAQLVQSATRGTENPQGVDILSPFRLPYSMKRVRLQPGRALLEF